MTTLQDIFGTPHPVALVTGSGAPRIGNHVACHLADRGYHLVIHANSNIAAAQETAKRLTRDHKVAISVQADLVDESAVGTMFQQVQEAFGRLDVLVNCAAIWESKNLDNVTVNDVRRHFEANTLGTFLCCQQAGWIMTTQKTGGAIVNLGDWAVARPYCDYAAYFPSKGAMGALTRSFAVELASRNPRVRVNEILPGPVMLPADMPANEKATAITATLVKREGSPQNLATAVAFLLENDFITGVSLPVDGGRTVYAPS